MKVSVVIVVERVNDYVRENIDHQLKMDFTDFEILLLLSQETEEKFPKTRIIVRPDLADNPAKRRDLALEARGEILAFIDDDAYPSSGWLGNSIAYFDDLTIAAVCGPGVTPKEDNFFQQVSGWSSASPFGGGPNAFYRFFPDRIRAVDDYASMNLIVRKSDFSLVGGFDSNYWPGEDTKLCLDLSYKIGKKIIYDPAVLVYHHRRPVFRAHLRQNGRYGFHRGYFARIFPKTSRRLAYFLPSAFALFFFLTPALSFIFFFSGLALLRFYGLVVLFYGLMLVLNSFWIFRKSGSYRVALLSAPTIFLTHLWYGLQFLRGLLSPRLSR